MNPGNGTVVSVMDVGGTHVTAASVDVETRSLRSGRSFREPLDGDGSAEEILSALVRCAARLPAQSATRWAVALPGPFDYERGIGWYEGVGKFDALRGFDLRAALTASLPDAARISFCNDADAFVLGEWWAGAARGHRSVVGITLGTGVGSCFLRDGRILRHGPGVPLKGGSTPCGTRSGPWRRRCPDEPSGEPTHRPRAKRRPMSGRWHSERDRGTAPPPASSPRRSGPWEEYSARCSRHSNRRFSSSAVPSRGHGI